MSSDLRRWVLALGTLAIVTAGLLPLRERLDKAHVSLALLTVVLLASATGGRRLGVAMAASAFLAFNFFFLPPFYTLVIADPLDWSILVAFLVVGIVAAQLLHRAQHAAAMATARAEEIDRLSAEAERNAALREADRLKDAVLASVSHDLRTPLTTIRGLAAEIAQSGDERAMTIAEESGRLGQMVDDLLDLSTIKAGALRPAIAINAAEDVMGATLQRVSGVTRGRDLRASLDTSEPVLVGRFDFSFAVRVLVNFLENALKYTDARSPVEFRVRRDDQTLVFEVLDRGAGVPEASRTQIFEPFHRADGDATTGASGAGLGLAIAAGLAAAMSGRVTYAPREGGGSIFSLLVPAADLHDID
jgi:two-component system, OmpR family, sensor histidine kinase KdpD